MDWRCSGARSLVNIEAEIWRGLSAGDERSFSRLVGSYGARVRGIARQFLGDGADADDAMQEVFIKVWRSGSSFDPERATLSTWLYRITANVCLDRLRQQKRWRWLGMEFLADRLDETTRADEALVQRQAIVAVTQDIRALPDRQRLALLLVTIGECSAQEVASIMDISKGGAEQLIVRARKFLRQRQRERDGNGSE